MDIKSLANSVAAALTAPIQYGANVNDAGTNQQVTQNIRNLGSLDAKGDIAKRASGALGASANAQDEAEKAAARQAAAQKDAELKAAKEEADRLNDPKNFKAIINDVGGYDFYDPSGAKISAVNYAKATNSRITDLYKDSQDPNDKDFVEDYNEVLELGKILESGDKKARDKWYAEKPERKKAYDSFAYNDIVKDLRAEYPGYFRSQQELTRGDNYDGRNLGTVDRDVKEPSTLDRILGIFRGNNKTAR